MPPKTDALVLLPALLCDSRLYQNMVEALETQVPIIFPEIWHVDNLAGLARSMLESLPASFALAGNSMGGYLALELLRQAPERVTHLALIGTNAHADPEAAREKREQAIRLAEADKFKVFVDGYVVAALFEGNRQRCGQTLRAMARDLGARALVNEQMAIMSRRGSEDILPSISVPTVVVCGREDAFASPKAHSAMAKAIPGAPCHVIENCGHLVPLEAPDSMARMLDNLLARQISS